MAYPTAGVLVKSGPTLPYFSVATVLWATFAGQSACADESFEPITPYRPSVSSPAQLPAAGQLEFELGGLHQRSDDATRNSIPYLFKLAFNEEWGFLIGGEAHVWQHDGTGRSQGAGDTMLTLKRAWTVDDSTAIGAEFAVKLPTANDSIGSGKTDWSLNTIYSRDFGPVHMDANLNALRMGQIDPGAARTQWGASTSFSTALSERWGVTAEWSGSRRTGAPSGTQVLAAVTYSPSKFLTFDMGAARAARPAPSTTMLFGGMVMPLARLW